MHTTSVCHKSACDYSTCSDKHASCRPYVDIFSSGGGNRFYQLIHSFALYVTTAACMALAWFCASLFLAISPDLALSRSSEANRSSREIWPGNDALDLRQWIQYTSIRHTNLQCRDPLVFWPSIAKTRVPVPVSRVGCSATTGPGSNIHIEPISSRGCGSAHCEFRQQKEHAQISASHRMHRCLRLWPQNLIVVMNKNMT